jgi:beta-lactam-binding protein with PASTA domain
VTVAAGPLTVPVPNVIGMTVQDATAALQQAGLAVGGVYGPNGGNRHVFYSNPQAGTKVNRGSQVSLFVN